MIENTLYFLRSIALRVIPSAETPHTMPNIVQPKGVLFSLKAHSAHGVYVPAISIKTVQWSITCITFLGISRFKPWYTLDIV